MIDWVSDLLIDLEFSLTIQKSSMDFNSDRTLDVYFPPVSLNGKSACLQMNFTAFAYFAIKLTHASPTTNVSTERMLFRSVQSLGKEFRYWETNIEPHMTQGEEFVIVLHTKSSSFGTMAVINSINLHMAQCYKTGQCSSVRINTCYADVLSIAMRIVSVWNTLCIV